MHTSKNVFVPLTVGGGIRDFTDASGRYMLIFSACFCEHFCAGIMCFSFFSARTLQFLSSTQFNIKLLWLRYYSSLEVAAEYFRSGADKISIGSDAVYAAEEFVKSGVSLYLPI